MPRQRLPRPRPLKRPKGSITSEDWTSWDVPDLLKPPEPTPTPRLNRRQRRHIERARPARPATLVPNRFEDPDAMARLDHAVTRDESRFIHPDVLFASANSGLTSNELEKAIRYLARETQLDPSLIFSPFNPQGTQPGEFWMTRKGVVIPARQAREIMDQGEPDFLRRALRSSVDQFNDTIPVRRTAAKKRHRGASRVKVPHVSKIINVIFENAPKDDLDELSLDKVLGMAIQVSARLANKRQRALFEHNFSQFKDQTHGQWSYYVVAAEEAARRDIRWDTPLQAITESGLVDVNPESLRGEAFKASIAKYGIHAWEDPQGNINPYMWDPFRGRWVPAGGQELRGLTGVLAGALGLVGAELEKKILEVARPRQTHPSQWADPTDGGAPSKLAINLAGFVPTGDVKFDPARVGDYYREAQEILYDDEMRRIVQENNAWTATAGKIIEAIDWGWRHAAGALTRAVTVGSAPAFFVAGGADLETFDAWWDEMHEQAGEIEAGRETIGTLSAKNLHLPEWAGVIGLDLPSIFVLDPWIAGAKLYRAARAPFVFDELVLGGKRVSYMGRGLEWLGNKHGLTSLKRAGLWMQKGESLPQFGARLTKRFGKRGQKMAERLWRAGRAFDERVGIPISGMYETRTEALEKFVEWQITRQRRYLGNKTFSRFFLDEADAIRLGRGGGDLHARANEFLRGHYSKEAFHPELTRSVEQIVGVGRASALPDEQIMNHIDDLLRAGFGTKPLDAESLRLMIREPGVLTSADGFDDLRLVGPEPTLRNTVGDVDVQARMAGRPAGWKPDPAQAFEFARYDHQAASAAIDEVAARFADARRLQFDMPRYSRGNRVSALVRQSAIGNTELGKLIDAGIFNRVPEAIVPFEGGKYVRNVERRLRRTRTYSHGEQQNWLARARRVSEQTNPNREGDMLQLLEELQKDSWNRIADSYRVPRNIGDELYKRFEEQTDSVNFAMADEAFNVKIERLEDGTLSMTPGERPVLESQLLDRWYVPDPLAMRRSIRDVLGTWTSTEQFAKNLAADFRLSRINLDATIESSVQRRVVHDQLDDALDALQWTGDQKQWARDVLDLAADSALRNRPDIYETADDFFKSFGVQFSREFQAKGASPGTLFKRIVEADPDLERIAGELKVFMQANPTVEQWYDASVKSLESLAPKYFWGKTTLADGTEVQDFDLFTQILAVTSARASPDRNLEVALETFYRFKVGGKIEGVPPNVRGMLGDIAKGRTLDRWEELKILGGELAPSAQRRLKVWNFWNNLNGRVENVTVDTWMARIFGYGDRITNKQNLEIQGLVKRIAADLGIRPMHAQAALWGMYKTQYTDKVAEWARILRVRARAVPGVLDDFPDAELLSRRWLEENRLLDENIVEAGTTGFRSPEEFAALKASIEKNGITEPIQLEFVGDGFRIADGNHKMEIARLLGIDEVPAVILEIDDAALAAAEAAGRLPAELGSRLARPSARGLPATRPAPKGALTRAEVDDLIRESVVAGLPPTRVDLNAHPETLLAAARQFERQVPLLRDARHFGDLLRLDENIQMLDQIGRVTGDAARITHQRVTSWLRQVRAGETLGAFEPIGEFKGIIRLFETGDVNTFVHESGHFIRRILPADDIAKLERHFGVSFTGPLEGRRSAEEAFANALETYFATRTAPREIKGILEHIRDFIARVWRKLRGGRMGDDLDPTLREIFSEWFPEEGIRRFPGAILPEEISENVMAQYAKRVASWAANDVYLRIWKPFQVLRFGYILRVPGFDEQVRFLIDMGLGARIRGQGIVGDVATRLADRGYLPRGWIEDVTYIPTKTGESLEVVRKIPGALPDEAYANSTIRANEVYQTFSQQAKQVVKGAERRRWGMVHHGDGEFEDAFDLALNGHLSASVPGRRALAGVAKGHSRDDIVNDLLRFAEEDPMGTRIVGRINRSADELSEWAEELTDMVRRYTLNNPEIAAAALRREAHAGMIDGSLKHFTDYAAGIHQTKRGANRTLHAFSEGEIEETAAALRGYTKANGGATFDPVTGRFYEDKGYALALHMGDEGEVIIPTAHLDDPEKFRAALDASIAKSGDDLRDVEGSFLGTWIDERTDQVFIGPAQVTKDFREAMGLGILREQDSIFDFAALDDIPVFRGPSIHGLKTEMVAGEGVHPVRPVVDALSRWILQMPTNRLARQPYFKSWFDRIMELQLDMQKASGYVPADVAAAERMLARMEAGARRFAIDRVHRVMFNFRDQSRLSEIFNFISPFFQPWQEAFSVYSHLLKRNPALAGYVNAAFRTARDVGAIRKDPDTGEWVVPLSNFAFMAPLMGVVSHWDGMSMSAPLTSFNLFFNNAFPLPTGIIAGDVNIPLPSLSPPVTWLIQQFKDNDESRVASWLYQFGDVGLKKIAPFPTWLQNGITSLIPNFNEEGFTAYTDDFLRLQQFMGVKYDSPQEAIEAAEAQAQIFYRYKTAISFLFPASPRIEFPFKELEDEFRRLIEKFDGDVGKARDVFSERHPDMWLITQAKTVWEREDPNLPAGFQTPSIPATEAAEKILKREGFSDFAEQFPGMAWAILPQEAYAQGEFSPDIFRKTLARADRRYLEPLEFYARGEASAGWEAYWHRRELWDAEQERMRADNVQENDPQWEQAKQNFNGDVMELRRLFPSFGDELGDFDERVIDPRVLAYARALLEQKVFLDFPVGKGLQEYMALRDGIDAEMSKLGVGSIDSGGAADAGMTERYEKGVEAIIEKYPDFRRAYDVFFRGKDLMRVRSEASKAVDALPEAIQEEIFEWQRNMNDLENQIDVAPDDLTRAPLYLQQANMFDSAYKDFETNPAEAWFDNQDYSSQQDKIRRTLTKPFIFLNRFERERILGLKTNDFAEQTWKTIAELRAEISRRGAFEADFQTGAAYEQLNQWIVGQMQADPVFASQVAKANTWGWAFFNRSELMGQSGAAGDAWRNFQETVQNFQAGVEQADIHGTGNDEAVYNSVRQQLIQYVEMLKSWSATFGEQWNSLETSSTADLIDAFMPQIWYRTGA